jgi:hypothetical protein
MPIPQIAQQLGRDLKPANILVQSSLTAEDAEDAEARKGFLGVPRGEGFHS